jgi:hypothetical protein
LVKNFLKWDKKNLGTPPPKKKKKKIEKSELPEMARTLIEKSDSPPPFFEDGVDDVVGGIRGGRDLGFLRAQIQEARTPLGMRQY